MPATRYDLRIEQGKTLQRLIRWETPPIVYVPITAMEQVAPVLITAPSHAIPDGWRVAVLDVVGMHELNAKHQPPRTTDFRRVTVVNPNQISFNDVSAIGFDPYVSGGTLAYYTPLSLAGYSARMQIKDRVGGAVLAHLGSVSGEIVINTTNFTITLLVDAAVSAAWTWKKGVYDLELISAADVVSAILTGSVTLSPEVTTSST